ncbi:RNA methyltransferase [Kineosporia rhizophila]|uniref:TrmH family RNA methyltransferase n=1 Tax=Kineosporia rhizophila TaxID=84633 RepID=UPI001E42CC1A|nr:RNA methyltransferase [Kineosporia sp. NBRC 101677]MCE0539408.1 RNA methyltransferase [Kineosporia rhizophila]GLY18409.1 rRNA methyltransferase [Kineosporia sp. NBRC 101677]
MTLIHLDDPHDERLSDYVGLTDVVLRTRLEPAGGLYMAESEKVIRRALRAGHRPRSMMLAEKWRDSLDDLVRDVQAAGAPVFTGPIDLVEAITGFNVHRGAIAAMHRPVLPSVESVVAGARRIVVLENITDHTNVGAIFRSVAGLGADAVLVTPRCADPLYRRSVRVSMGTVFQVPWTRIDPWPGGMDDLQKAGFDVAALALGPNAVSLDEYVAKAPEKVALVLGTEGDGLSPVTIEHADRAVTIPMAGGVDSLNVAAAAAVAMWSLRVG